MSLEALEERYSPSELRRLRAEAEELRERLVSTALRGRKRLRRRVTVGRTPLGECLRQLAEAEGQWEAVVREEGGLRGEEGQVTLLNLLEKGLALMERVQALREKPRKKRKRKRKEREEEPPGQAPQGEAPPRQKKSGKGGGQNPEGGEAPEGRAARDGPGPRPSRGEDQEEDPGEEEGDHERGNEGGERPESEGDSSGNTEDERHSRYEDQDYAFWGDSDEEEDDAKCDSLLVKINNLEQKIFSLQDPSQEEVNDLVKEVESLKFNYQDISHDVERTLVYSVMDLWSALWLFSFKAVSVLQETLSQFSAVNVGFAKVKSDSLCSIHDFLDSALHKNAMLHLLLKKGQERINALQEKVDAVKGISLAQTYKLKWKICALQKQMGDLKEMTALLALTYKLVCKLWSGCIIEENAFWKKTRDLALTLKVHLNYTGEGGQLLWAKAYEFEADLHENPVEKLMMLEEKVSVCIRKLNVFHSKQWEPLGKELKFLKEKLHSLGDLSHRELNKLQEELDEAQKDLDLQIQRRHETSESYRDPMFRIRRKTDILRDKMNALHKVDAPLVVNDEERNAGGCSGRTGNLNYSVSTSAPHSSTGLSKTWHTEVTQEERCVLVKKFAKMITPDNDSEAAKKILEAYARQMEEEVYSLANSKTEYHQLMATKLNVMNKKLDETLRSPSPIHGIRSNEQEGLLHPLEASKCFIHSRRITGIQPVQMSNAGSVSMEEEEEEDAMSGSSFWGLGFGAEN